MLPSCGGGGRVLVVNGVPVAGAPPPPVSSFLEFNSGAYTTTRTHGHAALVLFWGRHLRRLAESATLLADSRPDIFAYGSLPTEESLGSAVNGSLHAALELALPERARLGSNDELAITALVRGRADRGGGARHGLGIDVLLHIGLYVPPVFGASGAHLAVAGTGREMAAAKYSDWVWVRKGLERLRPPMATELLLTKDGDNILEGTITNFFVVCGRDHSSSYSEPTCMYEVQTAPVSDGVLPGIIRQLVIEICSGKGIPLKEVAPSWSSRELWQEAFITSSLRLVQHVETIQAPNSFRGIHLKTWSEVAWEVKHFEGIGLITTQIQKELIGRLAIEGHCID